MVLGRAPAGSATCRLGLGCLPLGVSGGLLSFSLQIDWGDFTLEPTRVDDGAAADGGAQGEEIDWGITLEPSPQVCKPRLCGPGVWPRSRAGLATWGCPGYPQLTGCPFFCSRMMALTGETVKARRCRSRCWRPALRVSTAAEGQRGSQRVAGSTHPAFTPPSLPAVTLGILAVHKSLLGRSTKWCPGVMLSTWCGTGCGGGYDQTIRTVEIPSLPYSLPGSSPSARGSRLWLRRPDTPGKHRDPEPVYRRAHGGMTRQAGLELGKGQLCCRPTAGMAVPECPPALSLQLELFLSQRLVEMEEEADIVAVSQFQLAPAVLQGQTSAHVGSLLATTRALLGQLCTRSMQHLFMILASPRSLLAGWEKQGGRVWGGGRLWGSAGQIWSRRWRCPGVGMAPGWAMEG